MKLPACSSPPITTATNKDTNANIATKKTSFIYTTSYLSPYSCKNLNTK